MAADEEGETSMTIDAIDALESFLAHGEMILAACRNQLVRKGTSTMMNQRATTNPKGGGRNNRKNSLMMNTKGNVQPVDAATARFAMLRDEEVRTCAA